ncbi:MAG TPA: hypothetical protein VLF94_00480, partial [Chlamydiales bacterium]|nr:hypothetical protein [Chlamydiales bacterium]
MEKFKPSPEPEEASPTVGRFGPVSSKTAFVLFDASGRSEEVDVKVAPEDELETFVEFVRPMHDIHQFCFKGQTMKILHVDDIPPVEDFETSYDGLLFVPIIDVVELKRVIDLFLESQFGDAERFRPIVEKQHAYKRLLKDVPKIPQEQAPALFARIGREEKGFKQLLAALPERARKQADGYLASLERRENLDTFEEEFILLERVKTVLGETLYKQICSQIPIRWKLPEANVSRFLEMLDTTSEPGASFLELFAEEKDHIVGINHAPLLISVMKSEKRIQNWLCIEEVKRA